jgi:hypothetical protein
MSLRFYAVKSHKSAAERQAARTYFAEQAAKDAAVKAEMERLAAERTAAGLTDADPFDSLLG